LPNCGKRPNAKGIPVFQGEIVKRDDEMRLIASYVGWQVGGLHGVQLEAARRTARLELSPVTAKEYTHGVRSSVSGYIAGMPDSVQKKVADLLMREQIASKMVVDHEKAIAASNDYKRTLHIGLLAVEHERIKAIRKELSELGAL
jgi:hypothetical protein